jgi:hypothetical protein
MSSQNTIAAATAGLDYTLASGSLSWASGDKADKQITVPILKDFLTEGPEVFSVYLQVTTFTRIYSEGLINDVPPTSMGVWQNQWWPGVSDLNVIGDGADPDKDGMSNLREYALGSNPTQASPTRPVVTIAEDHLNLTFTRAKQATDVLYQVEASTDLAAWNEICPKRARWTSSSHLHQVEARNSSGCDSIGRLNREKRKCRITLRS